MQFVASLTRRAGELDTMLKLWREHGDDRNPFKNVMITPLFIPESGMRTILDWRESGITETLYFDSGGFYVQMGKIDYVELYTRLLKLYREKHCADWYVLPDHVPTSGETEERVWSKVRDTAEYGRMFFEQMPHQLHSRAIPVVHGFTMAQLEYSLEAVAQLGVGYAGFGSFSTSGKNSAVNKMTVDTYRALRGITQWLDRKGIRLHGFGVSTPPVLHILNSLAVYSFDSIGWMKTAGFGKIYMPFIRAYNITYLDPSNRTITEREFHEMREVTGHRCHFCDSFRRMHEDRFYRIMHNLSVTLDMISGTYSHDQIEHILRRYSPDYTPIWDTKDGEIGK